MFRETTTKEGENLKRTVNFKIFTNIPWLPLHGKVTIEAPREIAADLANYVQNVIQRRGYQLD